MGRRVRVSAREPEAAGVCDCCGFVVMHADLRFQREYAGRAAVRTGTMRCPRCLDAPHPHLKVRELRPDPVPIANARPGFAYTGPDNLVASSGDALETDNEELLVKQNGA